ncbi:fibrobacter succinogenes major paralogous domain-containing protein [candidate division KSB1 bacterium]|nr:fibrobacter succinogenes major paralogous domain-containing protein [candidate division KSB1 bacterium]
MNTIKMLPSAFLFFLIVPIAFCQPGKMINIGNQVWMKENLNVSRFRNGDPIPEAKTIDEWLKAGKDGKPAWCFFENKPVNGDKYGKLYNWHAVNDSRQLAPEGWHVPTNDEWQILIDYYGGRELAGGPMKETGTKYWKFPNTGATNDHGFSALPGGHRDNTGHFYNLGHYATFWTATKCNQIAAWKRHLSHGDTKVYIDCFDMTAGFSIRCIRD